MAEDKGVAIMIAFDKAWDIAKDFFFDEPDHPVLAAAMGAGKMGHFVAGDAYDKKFARDPEKYGSKGRNRWRYDDEGNPEQYFEEFDEPRMPEEQKKGFFGVRLSNTPANMWNYGIHGKGVEGLDNQSMMEGIELGLHHEGMHSAMNPAIEEIYMDEYRGLIRDGVLTGTSSDAEHPAFKDIQNRWGRTHEYGAHLGQQVGIESPNRIAGRYGRGQSPKDQHNRRWHDYRKHPATRFSLESILGADELERVNTTNIPFPVPPPEGWVEESEPASEMRGGGIRAQRTPKAEDYEEMQWDETEDGAEAWDTSMMRRSSIWRIS